MTPLHTIPVYMCTSHVVITTCNSVLAHITTVLTHARVAAVYLSARSRNDRGVASDTSAASHPAAMSQIAALAPPATHT